MTVAERTEVKVFAERLERIFQRNEKSTPCSCGQESGHLSTCPKHAWETAVTIIQMELEETIGR